MAQVKLVLIKDVCHRLKSKGKTNKMRLWFVSYQTHNITYKKTNKDAFIRFSFAFLDCGRPVNDHRLNRSTYDVSLPLAVCHCKHFFGGFFFRFFIDSIYLHYVFVILVFNYSCFSYANF